MKFTFYDIFRFIAVFQFLYIAIILITLRRGNKLSNRIFAVFLFSKTICFANSLIFRYGALVAAWSPHVFYIGESFEFLLGPSLYLYALSLAYQNFSLKKRHALHLIPFLIHAAFMSAKYHFYSAETKLHFLRFGFLSPLERNLNIIAMYIHFLVYSILILIILHRYRIELKQYFSSIKKIRLLWLSLMVGGFIVIWGTGFVHYFYILLGGRPIFPNGLSIVLLFIFANIILYKGIKQPEIFGGIEQEHSEPKPIIPKTMYNQYVKKLNTLMKKDKPYLTPSISLSDLADKISISPRYLSYVINKSYNQNFFTFINSFRIKESIKMLSHPENHSKTVLEILYDVGFNNKSVFNAAFKKHTGMTPTQFKQQNQL